MEQRTSNKKRRAIKGHAKGEDYFTAATASIILSLVWYLRNLIFCWEGLFRGLDAEA